jgi:hypothetical protein
MVTKEKSPSVAQKCMAFERIREIIEDEIGLEEHLRKHSDSVRCLPDATDFARLNAYADIVFAVMRPDAIARVRPKQKSRRRHSSPPPQKGVDRARKSL